MSLDVFFLAINKLQQQITPEGFFENKLAETKGLSGALNSESEELSSSPDRGLLCRVLRQDT